MKWQLYKSEEAGEQYARNLVKLAEALLSRAQLKKDCDSLLNRIEENALVQEGEEPGEDPTMLISRYEEKQAALLKLIQQINATNASTPFNDKETIADALAHRDILASRLGGYRSMYNAARIQIRRVTGTEIRLVRCLEPTQLQATIDDLSKEYRELDTAIQSLNWTVDLKE